MIRLLGAALLACGSAALGFGAVGRLDGRVDDLRGLMSGVELMERELGWNLSPLPQQLRRAAGETQGRPAQFFSLCAQGAEHLNGRPFHQVWREAAEACQMRLERTDLELLEGLGGVLGRYDGDSQRRALSAAAQRLEEQLAQAVEQRGRLGRVYGVLGLTAGAFLMILLA